MSQPPHARVEVLKGARGCGAKHVSKSKCKKHRIVGTLLDVERLKNCTPFRREAHFEVKAVKTHSVRTRHRATKGPQVRHQSQPSAISATPAQRCHTCHAKRRSMCHACHTKCRMRQRAIKGPQARHQSQPSAISATPATRNDSCVTKVCVKDGV